jgi:hypothetical protein
MNPYIKYTDESMLHETYRIADSISDQFVNRSIDFPHPCGLVDIAHDVKLFEKRNFWVIQTQTLAGYITV